MSVRRNTRAHPLPSTSTEQTHFENIPSTSNSEPLPSSSTIKTNSKQNNDKLLTQVYYNPKEAGSYYGSISKIHQNPRLLKHKITKHKIKTWIKTQEALTIHKGIRRKFKRNRVLAIHALDMMDIDLADFSSISKQNDDYKFLLFAIDILSKKLYGVPLKNKTSGEILQGMKIIFSKTPKLPLKVRSDSGGEFVNNILNNYVKSLKIKHTIARNTETKANYVERVIRTIRGRLEKFFSHKQTHRYIDHIQDFITSYNNSLHRSIKMAPNKVTAQTEWLAFKNNYIDPLVSKKIYHRKRKVDNRYKVGDSVRISKLKSQFHSKYDNNWTYEFFTVLKSFIREGIPVYKVGDWHGERIKGIFYQSE